MTTNIQPSTSPDGDLTVAGVISHEAVNTALQQRQAKNIRGHLSRNALRVTVLLASDIAAFVLVIAGLTGLKAGSLGRAVGAGVERVFPLGVIEDGRLLLALLLSLAIAGTYGPGDARRDSSRIVAGTALAALIAMYETLWRGPAALLALQAAAVVVVIAGALYASRMAVDALVWRVRPRLGVARAVVVAHTDADWRDLAGLLRRIRDFVVVERVTLDEHTGEGVHPRLRGLGRIIDTYRAETVLLWGNLTDEELGFAVDISLASGCRLLAGARRAVGHVEPKGVWIGGRQLVELTPPTLSWGQLALKRAADIVGAVVGLTVFLPVMLVIAVLVKLESRGSVIFAHERLGVRGRVFRCFKFRSMREDAEAVLRSNSALYEKYIRNHFKLPREEDPRLTRVGRFLRRTSLDELPQLINVLLGDMSLVGPRPIVPAELSHYGSDGALVFLSLKPGITGAWAVNGRSDVGYPDRAEIELEYIRRWSLASDVAILARTLPAVLARRGAH